MRIDLAKLIVLPVLWLVRAKKRRLAGAWIWLVSPLILLLAERP